jgi:FkbM family methyltransferase
MLLLGDTPFLALWHQSPLACSAFFNKRVSGLNGFQLVAPHLVMRIENICCHSFLADQLRSAKVILDCGSNRGKFARWMNAHTPATIHGFEPDPRLFATLPKLAQVQFHPLAIDGEAGEFDLALGEDNCSSAIYRERKGQPTVRVRKVTLDGFCREHKIKEIDLIKIDIEGAELSLLEKTSEKTLQSIKQITIEFHDFLRKDDLPRIEAIVRRLAGLGFYGIRFSQFTWGDCLFINSAYIPTRWLDRAKIKLSGKWLPGMKRLARRKWEALS